MQQPWFLLGQGVIMDNPLWSGSSRHDVDNVKERRNTGDFASKILTL